LKIKCKILVVLLFITSISNCFSANAVNINENSLYNEYRESFDAIYFDEDIEKKNFRIIENQTFEIEHGTKGKLNLISAINRKYNRLAMFFIGEDKSVVFKTDDFVSNFWFEGKAKQTNKDVIAIAYRDLNGDGLKDLIIVSSCQNDSGVYADKMYNVGDVLFQNSDGFYRDPRISDKINRFDMNKHTEAIIAFVRDGISMEFLFTAKTLDDLSSEGFKKLSYLQISDHLEKFGVVDIVPGFYKMTGQNYLMIYIVDSNGKILWNFQPMHYYVNFYDMIDLSLKDVDGDGNKDLTVLARYVTYNAEGTAVIRTDYNIYYQRAGYFLEDTDFKNSYSCREDDGIDVITNKARQFWGWR